MKLLFESLGHIVYRLGSASFLYIIAGQNIAESGQGALDALYITVFVATIVSGLLRYVNLLLKEKDQNER